MPYATQADLTNVGMPAAALGSLTTAQINATLQAASDYADTFFRARWGAGSVPLQQWDTAVTHAVAKIASLWLVRVRGYDPRSTADQRFQQGYDEAVAWLDKVQRQQAHPLVTLKANSVAIQQPTLLSTSVVNLSSGGRSGNRGW